MTDRELLELAAKAAGLDAVWDDYQQEHAIYDHDGVLIGGWDPLNYDGDALRLAVKLKMRIGIDSIPVGYVVVMSDDPLKKETHELIDSDPYAATRRAIVRAAAQIGEQNDH